MPIRKPLYIENGIIKEFGASDTVAVYPLKMPSYVVAASGGDFTTIQAALDAAASAGGGYIFLQDDYYTITSGLRFKGSNCHIFGKPGRTVINVDGATVSTLFATNSSTGYYERNGIHHLIIQQTNTNALGTAIDASNMCSCIYDDLWLGDFATAIKLADSNNFTFYNIFNHIDIYNPGSYAIQIDGTTPTNDNSFYSINIILIRNNVKGIYIKNAQANYFYNVTVESASSGCTGIQLVNGGNGTFNNAFFGTYLEALAYSIDIGSSCLRNSFFGLEAVENGTGIIDNGTDTTFVGTNNEYAPYLRLGGWQKSPIADRHIQLKVIDDATTLTTGNNKIIFMIPQEMAGYRLISAHAYVSTASSSGAPTIMVRNNSQAVDMLSTAITIDANEYNSYTAATPPVVNTSNNQVWAGEQIAINVTNAGTGAKGLGVHLIFSNV